MNEQVYIGSSFAERYDVLAVCTDVRELLQEEVEEDNVLGEDDVSKTFIGTA